MEKATSISFLGCSFLLFDDYKEKKFFLFGFSVMRRRVEGKKTRKEKKWKDKRRNNDDTFLFHGNKDLSVRKV